MKSTSLQEISHLLKITAHYNVRIEGVAVDSRLIRPGDLFFALPGAKVDGHAFLAQAAANGAAAAVVHTAYAGSDFGLPLLRSEDVLESLQLLAKTLLQKGKAQVVAVTGSLGKTSTKGFISQILSKKFKVSTSPGNSNSQIGLPLSIINHFREDDEILILEMGMTEAGQIARLVEIAPPTIAVVTLVALVHACYFESIEDIARAKAEIFSHPATKLGIYHFDSNLSELLSGTGSCPKISFSTFNDSADFFLKSDAVKTQIRCSEKQSSKQHSGAPFSLIGEQTHHNFLAAAVVAAHLGMSWDEILDCIPSLALPERRLETIEKYGATFINDAYNAAELSMKAALKSLPTPKANCKRIAVFGGIVELGKYSKACHRSVGEHALKCVDLMLCFGEECKEIRDCWEEAGRQVVWAPERSEIVKALKDNLQPGDVVLLKGSRSKNVCKVLEEL